MDTLICDRVDYDDWKIYTATNYVQLYKKEWEHCQVHFELLKSECDGLVPDELIVVLHTHERKSVSRTDCLRELGKKIGEKKIKISYESQETFEKSMVEVFEVLNELIKQYTDTIDSEMKES